MKKEWYLSLKFIKTFTKSLAVSPQRLKKQAFNKNKIFFGNNLFHGFLLKLSPQLHKTALLSSNAL